MRRLAACLTVLLAGTAAQAAEGEGCDGFRFSVARERAAFAGSLPEIRSGGAYPGPGTAVSVALSPQEQVDYAVAPRRAPKAVPAHGAQLSATIPSAGTYQVTLSGEGWIDLVQDGRVLRSSAFSGARGCPDVRKSVRFDLASGPVTIAISDAAADRLALDVLPAE